MQGSIGRLSANRSMSAGPTSAFRTPMMTQRQDLTCALLNSNQHCVRSHSCKDHIASQDLTHIQAQPLLFLQGSTGRLSASSATSAGPTSASRTPMMTQRQDPRHGEAGCCSFLHYLASFLNASESCHANCGRRCQGERKTSNWARTCARVSLNPSTAQALTSCPDACGMRLATLVRDAEVFTITMRNGCSILQTTLLYYLQLQRKQRCSQPASMLLRVLGA